MLVIRCSPLVKAESVFAKFGGIRARIGRGEPQLVLVWRPVGRRHATEPIGAVDIREEQIAPAPPLRYSPTVQPCSSGSPGSAILLKFASSHAVPFKTAGTGGLLRYR